MDNTIYFSDVLLSFDTDIDFKNGDLLISSGQDEIKRKVFKLLITETGDWKIHKNVGASPIQFIGEKNNRETGMMIKEFIQSRLQEQLSTNIVNVRVIPIDYESVKVYIDIITDSNTISIAPFTIDFINGIRYVQFDSVVDSVFTNSTIKDNSTKNINIPNKYLDRLRFQ